MASHLLTKSITYRRTLVARNTTPQKSTENKTDETKKGANKDLRVIVRENRAKR